MDAVSQDPISYDQNRENQSLFPPSSQRARVTTAPARPESSAQTYALNRELDASLSDEIARTRALRVAYLDRTMHSPHSPSNRPRVGVPLTDAVALRSVRTPAPWAPIPYKFRRRNLNQGGELSKEGYECRT